MTFAGSALTPRELSWQWSDSKARVVFVSPELVQVVKDMFKLLNVSDEEARRRIWIMDQLWDENLLPPKGGGYGTENWLGYLFQKGRLDGAEKFDGEDANETAYVCYSSGTTVSQIWSFFLWERDDQSSFLFLFILVTTGETKGSRGENHFVFFPSTQIFNINVP